MQIKFPLIKVKQSKLFSRVPKTLHYIEIFLNGIKIEKLTCKFIKITIIFVYNVFKNELLITKRTDAKRLYTYHSFILYHDWNSLIVLITPNLPVSFETNLFYFNFFNVFALSGSAKYILTKHQQRMALWKSMKRQWFHKKIEPYVGIKYFQKIILRQSKGTKLLIKIYRPTICRNLIWLSKYRFFWLEKLSSALKLVNKTAPDQNGTFNLTYI